MPNKYSRISSSFSKMTSLTIFIKVISTAEFAKTGRNMRGEENTARVTRPKRGRDNSSIAPHE